MHNATWRTCVYINWRCVLVTEKFLVSFLNRQKYKQRQKETHTINHAVCHSRNPCVNVIVHIPGGWCYYCFQCGYKQWRWCYVRQFNVVKYLDLTKVVFWFCLHFCFTSFGFFSFIIFHFLIATQTQEHIISNRVFIQMWHPEHSVVEHSWKILLNGKKTENHTTHMYT